MIEIVFVASTKGICTPLCLTLTLSEPAPPLGDKKPVMAEGNGQESCEHSERDGRTGRG